MEVLMNKDYEILGQRVIDDKYLIAELINEEVMKDAADKDRVHNDAFIEQVIAARAGFIELLGDSLKNSCDEKKVYEAIDSWGLATGRYFLEANMMLDAALAESSLYRKHLAKLIKTEGKLQGIPMETIFEAMEFFHTLLDHAMYSYSSAYINAYQERLTTARGEFFEFSAPVVPIADKVAILPLVGDLEIDRAQFILEKTLTAANKLRISTLVIDLSGVVKVDSMVAEQIIKIVQALNMVGVKAILTGIRSEIAITLSQLGVDTRSLVTGGSLKQTLEKLDFTKL
ncbi:STAS domain-containing protein [Planococcus halotolerans]|uniref:STAS domain-containing protein n=2 Tax=Planococcus halotolerans TaxID=2233542 RepID=A0A365L6Q5_9BACL|nr:STAS domain-containing protein [Planococcus halotolerans]